VTNKKSLALVGLLCLSLLVAACASKPAQVLTRGAEGVSAPAQPQTATGPYAGNTAADTASSNGESERMIVRTAQLSLVVKDAEVSLEQVKDIVKTLNGYVVDTRMWRQEEQMRGTVTVRVPSEALDEALAKFKDLAVKVESESGGAQDVTEQYSDLGSQLRNLEATETELLELLKTVREKTGKAEDILAVYRELTSIRGQIEQIKGHMQYLERTSAMAAVTIELIPDVLSKPVSGGGWRPAETLTGALRALLSALQFLAKAVIWIVIFVLPVLIVVLIPFSLIWFIWRRRKGKAVPKA
jgi:hypothetical protein